MQPWIIHKIEEQRNRHRENGVPLYIPAPAPPPPSPPKDYGDDKEDEAPRGVIIFEF